MKGTLTIIDGSVVLGDVQKGFIAEHNGLPFNIYDGDGKLLANGKLNQGHFMADTVVEQTQNGYYGVYIHGRNMILTSFIPRPNYKPTSFTSKGWRRFNNKPSSSVALGYQGE